MALGLKIAAQKQQQSARVTLPDWQQHPKLIAHQQRLADGQAKLPDLEHQRRHTERQLEDAQTMLDRAETLYLAGRGDTKAVEKAKAERDAAKARAALAQVEHEEVEREVRLLSEGEKLVRDAAREETAGQLVEAYAEKLNALRALLDQAVALSEQMRTMEGQIYNQYPQDLFERPQQYPSVLGLQRLWWPDLRDGHHEGDEYFHKTPYTEWAERAEQWLAARKGYATPFSKRHPS